MSPTSRILLLAFAVLNLAPAAALAQAYPNKPIRYIVSFPPGGTSDVVARIVAQKLTEALGRQVVVENRGGASGVIGHDLVAKAPADGYTLLQTSMGGLVTNRFLYKNLPFDPDTDFAPISMLATAGQVLVVHPGVPARTLAELIAHARAYPGKLNYATGNTGGIVMTGMLASQAGMQLVHIPYKSEPPAITDLLSGNVQVMISSYATVAPHLREGKLRALVTTLPNRSPLLPEVPSIAEAGFKFPFLPWAGMFGPARMPKEVTERLNRELNALLARQDVRDSLLKQAFEPKGSGTAEFTNYVREQYHIWGRAIREAGIQPE